MQEHADPRHSGGARRGGSQDHGLPDPAPQRVVVQVVGWLGHQPDVPGPGPTDARALENRGRGNLRQGRRLPRPQRSAPHQQAVLRLVQPGAHAHCDRAAGQVPGHGGRARRQGLGVNEAGMKQMDDNIGVVLKKIDDMGQTNNTIVVFTTDNGAETITFPDGGVTPFKGGKLTTWEGGMRAPMVIRWPGVIKPGTIKNEMFASLDWVPTLVEIAGGPKGDGLKQRIEAGQYPGIVKTTLDGINQIDYLSGKSEKSARDHFLYYSSKTPSAVRYKNWKMYFSMVSDDPAGFVAGVQPYSWTQVVNVKRDPFETSVGNQLKTLMGVGGALASPSTAYQYDWNLLPIGQQLWLMHLETYIKFPPLQDPASYNLDQVMQQVKNMKTAGRSD